MTSTDPSHVQATDRPPSPDTLVLFNTSEDLGPTQEDEDDFAKELAKMMTDASAEARKVDKKTAQALWDSSVLPTGLRKKKLDGHEDDEDASDSDEHGTMSFVLLSKKGNKQQVLHYLQATTPLIKFTIDEDY